MRLQLWLYVLILLLGAVGLAGCGANPSAQAQPAPPGGIVLPTPPPMPTDPPLPPTPTPPPAPAPNRAPSGGPTLLNADFTSTDVASWTVIDAAAALRAPSLWHLRDGRLIPLSDADGLPSLYTTALVSGNPSWQDYTVSTSAYASVADEIGVVARAGAQGYYIFKLLPSGSTPALLLARYDAAEQTFTPLAQANTGGFTTRRWYTLRLQVQGQRLQAFVDDQLVLEARDATLAQGQAGVAGYAEGGLEFDQLTVQALTPGS